MAAFEPHLRTFRRLGVGAVAGVLAAGATLVAAAPGASAAAPAAVDCSTTNLQTAIDNAATGAALAVSGTCLGNYTINHNLTLLGHGNAVLDGQHSGTTVTVSSAATVLLDHLTITNGSAGAAGNGGGIDNSGTLTLNQSAVSNSAAGGFGAGIYNSGAVTLDQTTVSGNTGSVFGGGIYNNGAMTLTDTVVSKNSAQSGGGIFTGFGFSPVTFIDSNINDNAATLGSGGGVFNILDSDTLQNTTVSGNTAALEAGGINDNAGTTTIDNSIVTHNTAGSGGGGVFAFSGTVPLTNSTVSGNTPDNCEPPGAVTGCTG
jgi:hypothetical protein